MEEGAQLGCEERVAALFGDQGGIEMARREEFPAQGVEGFGGGEGGLRGSGREVEVLDRTGARG